MLGYSLRLPGGLFQGGEQGVGVMSRYHAGDMGVQRSLEVRKQASLAFHQVECEQAVKHAVYAGPKKFYDYEVGQTVYFWRKGMERQKKDSPAFWHGPGKVILTDLPKTVWVSYRGTLVKAAPEHLRPICNDEKFQFMDFIKDIVDTQKEIKNQKIRNYIILDEKPPALCDEPGQEGPEEREPEGPPPKKPKYRIEGKTAETEVEFRPLPGTEEGNQLPYEDVDLPPVDDEYTPTEVGEPPEPLPISETPLHGEDQEHPLPPPSPRSTAVVRQATEETGPPEKRMRTEHLEILYQELVKGRQQKGKEIQLHKLPARKKEKFMAAITKEVTNNLNSGAYEVLSRT